MRHKLGKGSLSGLHVAVQGCGSVGGGVAQLLAADGARLTLADIDAAKAATLAGQLGADHAPAGSIMGTPCDVFSPNALGAIFDEASIAALRTSIVAGGANNQLARPEHGPMLWPRAASSMRRTMSSMPAALSR